MLKVLSTLPPGFVYPQISAVLIRPWYQVPRDAAPNAGRRGYANVAALLRSAGDREPSPLELEFIGILLTAPHSASDNEAHIKDFLYAVLDISLKWNRPDMCTRVLQRFKDLGGLTVDPKMAFDIISLVGFDIIRPWFVYTLR